MNEERKTLNVGQVGKPGLARSRCVTANLPFGFIRNPPEAGCATLDV